MSLVKTLVLLPAVTAVATAARWFVVVEAQVFRSSLATRLLGLSISANVLLLGLLLRRWKPRG